MIAGTVTIDLQDFLELLNPHEGAHSPVKNDLHDKWAKIFERKGFGKREYIKLEASEARELLNDLK